MSRVKSIGPKVMLNKDLFLDHFSYEIGVSKIKDLMHIIKHPISDLYPDIIIYRVLDMIIVKYQDKFYTENLTWKFTNVFN